MNKTKQYFYYDEALSAWVLLSSKDVDYFECLVNITDQIEDGETMQILLKCVEMTAEELQMLPED